MASTEGCRRTGFRHSIRLPSGSFVDILVPEPSRAESVLACVSVASVMFMWVLSPLCPVFAAASAALALVSEPPARGRLIWSSTFWGCVAALPHVAALLRPLVGQCPRPTRPSLAQRLAAWWCRCGRAWFGAGSAVIYESEALARNAWDHGHAPAIVMLHPHGMFCLGSIFFMSCEPKMARARTVVGAALLSWAGGLLRAFLDSMAPLIANDRSSIKRAMHRKQDLYVCPGGFESATITIQGQDRDFFMSRLGLVKYALQGGYHLVPCYVFGESSLYFNLRGLTKLRLKLNSFGVPAICPFGWIGCPLLPKRVPLMLVYGDPVELPRIDSPSQDDIQKYHLLYVDALQKLYAKYAPLYYNDGQAHELTLV